MFEDTEVIAAIIAGTTVMITELIKISYSYFKEKGEKKKELTYFIDNDFEIDKKIWALLSSLEADRVYVGRFHNGGSYRYGVDIRKFSITNEAFSDTMDHLITPLFRERLMSEFTNLFRPLIFTGLVEIKAETEHTDKAVQKYLEAIGGKSAYIYIIKGVDDRPLAFLGIHFDDLIKLSPDKKENIYTFSQTLIPFLAESNKKKSS